MKHNSSTFKWRHYEAEVTLLSVRWYCRYQLSYRDLEEMMRERRLSVDRSTVFRWVQHYAPEINKRIRLHLKLAGASCRLPSYKVELKQYEKSGIEGKLNDQSFHY
jgi:transposase, IS6 family